MRLPEQLEQLRSDTWCLSGLYTTTKCAARAPSCPDLRRTAEERAEAPEGALLLSSRWAGQGSLLQPGRGGQDSEALLGLLYYVLSKHSVISDLLFLLLLQLAHPAPLPDVEPDLLPLLHLSLARVHVVGVVVEAVRRHGVDGGVVGWGQRRRGREIALAALAQVHARRQAAPAAGEKIYLYL